MEIFDALEIAARVHGGQVDLGGNPYMEHIARVAGRVSADTRYLVFHQSAIVTALLHDAVEDAREESRKIIRDEIQEKYGDSVYREVMLLTKDKKEDYFCYIKRLCANGRESLFVKNADLVDNMDLTRLRSLFSSDELRVEKYRKAHELVRSAIMSRYKDFT